MHGAIKRQSTANGCYNDQGCTEYDGSGYSVDKSKTCGNKLAYDTGLQSAFDEDYLNRRQDDLDVWDVDVSTSDFVVSTEPGVEINERVYEQIEDKISELINNAVTYAISQSLRGAINIRNRH